MKKLLSTAFLIALLAGAALAQHSPHAQAPTPSATDATKESDLLGAVHPVTFDGRRSGEGYFNRDGSAMIFQSEREPGNPFYQMYLMDLVRGTVHRVSPGYGKTTCGWIHPDGRQVLFASTHEDPRSRDLQREELAARASKQQRRYSWDFDEHFDIFRADRDGGRLVNLTHARGYDAEGCWSPDGQFIAFASNRHAYANGATPKDPQAEVDVYRMRSDGSEVVRLTDAPGYDGGPFFSADGRRICWRHFTPDGTTAEIYTMNADGSDKRQITHMGAMSWAPYFHPSGDYLIFATNKQGFGNFELYLIDAAGRHEPVRVTYSDGFDGLPVFTPDGMHLAWTSSRTSDHRPQIFMADWNDTFARVKLGLPIVASRAPALPALPVSEESMRRHVYALASDRMDGRLTGTEGEKRAVDYVVEQFRAMGLQPEIQPFTFTAGVKVGPGNRLNVGDRDFPVDRDWRPLAFSRTGRFAAAPVVFAGYGIVAPAVDGKWKYDSYAGLDVKDRWVLAFRFLPEGVPSEQRQHLARFSSLRYKAMQARDHGARGLIVVSGPNAQARDPLVKLTADASLGGSSIPALSVRDEVAQAMVTPGGTTLKRLQDALDPGTVSPGGALPDVTVAADVDLVQEKRVGHNVIATLSAPHALPGAIVVGAHLDHLGHGLDGSSLARGDQHGKIHYGADDNASGVAGVLEIARLLVRQQKGLRRDVIFAAWSGEELGLLGSAHFAQAWKGPRQSPHTLRPGIAACLNMDMIGRLDRAAVIQGYGSSTAWPALLECAATGLSLPIVTQDESYLPTDATSFYLQEVPILSAFTGAHSDYHTPGDVASKINYRGAARIASLMANLASGLAVADPAPDYRRMERPAEENRAGMRAYLGSIPDYAQGDVHGVKLSGVAARGPAEKAGVRAGDVIVELAGHRIDNIYDYTYAIEALKIGVRVKMVVERDGQRIPLEVTPTSRE